MARNFPPRSPETQATTEIAVAAARLIADEGMDYANAKRRAAREVLGAGANLRGLLPDNEQVETEVRRHLRLFGGPEHGQRLDALRRHALALMQRLRAYEPRLVGAVLNGTATEHSDIQLNLYCDETKDIEFFLMNEGIDFDVDEGISEPGAAVERVHFVTDLRLPGGQRHRTGVILNLYPSVSIRTAPRRRADDQDLHPIAASGRASVEQLEVLLSSPDRREP